MKYGYLNLGRQKPGSTVEVKVRGGATRVLLLSAAEFVRYHSQRPFRYLGGRYRGQPVRIRIPRDDEWFAVLELGTYNDKTRATVEVYPPDSDQPKQREVVAA
jgi:hypothetical protein